MYLIDIQNPTHRNKNKARASMFESQNLILNKRIKQVACAKLNSSIIDDHRNHFYELKLGESNQFLTAYPLNKILN